MQTEPQSESLQTLQDIRVIMDRSTRFLSLSGWSGVWAGCTALAAAAIARQLLKGHIWVPDKYAHVAIAGWQSPYNHYLTLALAGLAAATFIIALAGGIFFTWRKAHAEGQRIWNRASRQLAMQLVIPMMAGGVFALAFLYYGDSQYIAPACLAFYGLALVNGSKYTITDIRYLGYLEILLGCMSLFLSGYGLYIWAMGFGVLHILYGIIMWNKYDKQKQGESR